MVKRFVNIAEAATGGEKKKKGVLRNFTKFIVGQRK